MSGATDTTRWDFALKETYTQDMIEEEVYKDQPFLAMVPKKTDFYGKQDIVPVVYGLPAGRSRKFSVAQGRKSGTRGVDFTITRKKDYAVVSVENELAEAAEVNAGAFLDAMTTEMDNAIEQLRRSMGISSFQDGSGKIATISAISGTEVTLTDAEDLTSFDVDQWLIAADSTSDSPRASGTGYKISEINREISTPKLTMASTPTGWQVGDVLFFEGDYEAAGDRTGMKGLGAWIPSSAPTSTAFNGVNRAVDTLRLGGVRVDCSGLPLNEALVKLVVQICKNRGRPTHAFISHTRYEQLLNLMETKKEYAYATAYERADISFEGLRLRTSKGSVDVFADVNCPSDVCYALTMKNWCLKSLGPAPHVLERQGRVWNPEATDDAWEARIGMYGDLYTNAPAYSGVGTSFGS